MTDSEARRLIETALDDTLIVEAAAGTGKAERCKCPRVPWDPASRPGCTKR